MSHTFDSGLMNAQRTLIANAIMTKLAPLTGPTGFLETIVPISFGIDSKHDLVELDLLSSIIGSSAPAVAIFAGALKPGQAGGPGKSRGDLHVDLYFVSTHRRDLTEGRATMDAIATGDDRADPGIFATVELVWALLYDVDLGLGSQFAQLKLASEAELSTDAEKTIWKQEWTIAVQRDANMYRGLTQKFTNAHTTLRQAAPSDEPTNKHIVEDTTVG